MEVMAGMIVGFDHDDPSIFAEQFDFIQDARIPVSMTGMLNAMPKTPLHRRLAEAGRLVAESVGDQFVFTNIVPGGMSSLQLYEGYRDLLQRLWTCMVRASPRRAWLTASILLETLVRRPLAFRDAVTFALVHKHLYEYMRDTCKRLDVLAAELRELPQDLPTLPAGSTAPDAA
jgi:uncharacterized protein DUF4070